jgi:hypothetical protein
MLSVAFLHGDMILLADLLTDPSFDSKSLGAILDPMLQPFDPKEYRIGNAFAAEFRSTAPVYKTISAANELSYTAHLARWSRLWNALQAHFFQLNDTENIVAEMAAPWVALGDSEPREFEQRRQAFHEWLDKDGPHLSPNYVYNPIGKILASLSGSIYDGYPLRAYDVAAYQRLVYLVFQLKRQHIATAEVPGFMQVHTDWSTHPVDDRTFSWNPETGELAVKTLGDHSTEQRFSISLR